MDQNDVQFNIFRVVLPLFTTTSIATSDPNRNQNLAMTQTWISALSVSLTLTLTCQIWYGAKKCPEDELTVGWLTAV